MKKFTDNTNGITYTVESVTAIATEAGDCTEESRQSALFVASVSESGEKFEAVVFGLEMPEDERDFFAMCDDQSAWDSSYETLETVIR